MADTRATLKGYFVAGAEPTETQFASLIDGLVSTKDDSTMEGALTLSTTSLLARGYNSTNKTPSIVTKWPAHQVESAAALTVTIAMILTGIITMDPTADRAWTLPTAALSVAGVAGVAVGDCIDFSVINTGTANADEIITLSAGTGGTLVGSGAVCTSNAVNDAMSTGSGLFRMRFTNVTSSSEAYHVYRIA
tara:strand:+ start:214 stop:789 length:576 start_codon:yes stop_codon:yes gene_type:complete